MFARLARLSDRLLTIAAMLLILAMLGSVFFGVVFRFLNRPLAWSDELAQYLLVWTGFVGWIIAGNRGSHIRVTVLLNRLHGKPRQLVEVLIQLLVGGLGVVLLTRSFGLIERNMDVSWVSLPLSAALVYIPIPIAGLAIVLQSALGVFDLVRGELKTGTPMP